VASELKKYQQIENCFRSAKIERSGFLQPAEFSEIFGAKDLSGFMKLSDLLKMEKCGAVQKTATLYFCTPDL